MSITRNKSALSSCRLDGVNCRGAGLAEQGGSVFLRSLGERCSALLGAGGSSRCPGWVSDPACELGSAATDPGSRQEDGSCASLTPVLSSSFINDTTPLPSRLVNSSATTKMPGDFVVYF